MLWFNDVFVHCCKSAIFILRQYDSSLLGSLCLSRRALRELYRGTADLAHGCVHPPNPLWFVFSL
jgi:hypothetical protein